ncbi:DNA-binding NarL/FixJ family response regulator [Mycolicibacterium sp. BK556]|uniref:LuxR C-terminal-related transcriptional regulator n=1 Tax=Mycobacteriaceae TaxID=1762 RepID=UPI000D36103B|nr:MULTISPECIES: LuxR C-terminal-related transcriptional regulator [Mycobacteriaceae]MBB3606649.1 DNA-binding NarL/FixJ family response regulator [Mycolicibacterium sp. BK556]MBB3636104.1 DNA-binding NarL/FixJ family response regulator [Mycolicibacterium sp. BK607]MBB3753732.1 DNA-binding NarL/FixJ family response regulator [Mycolicibacterium sp. BK634]
MGRGWQLLDRPAEFESIRSTLITDRGGGVVLVGPAGVGKTTLARTVTESLQTDVAWVGCTESSRSIPLGVFAHRIPPTGSRDPVALMAAARDAVITSPDTVIGVDDAHLLDQLSSTLLHQIAVERAGTIVATVRSGEPVPDAVTALWKDHHLRRLELAPLTKAQSVALIETVLGGTLEGLSADVMWHTSAGNPLFLRHMVEGALSAATLTEVDGVWQLRGDAGVPSGLAALLEDRLDKLSSDVVDTLKLLALCEPLDVDTLCELAGEDAVDTAEIAGLIRVVQDGAKLNARFSHPLYGDVVRRRIGTISARRLRGRIVNVLREQSLDSAASRLQLARLSVDSDEPVDSGLLLAATKDAIFLSNVPLGEHLARAAFERDGGVQSAELLSRTLLWQGHPVEAEQILARFSPDDLDELQLVMWGIPRLSILFWSMGDVERAHQMLSLLWERVEHPSLRLIVEATSSAIAVHQNQIDDGIAAAQAVLADEHAPKQAVDFAAFAAGLAMPVAGRGAAFDPIAARCRSEQKATDGMIRVMVRYCDVLALTYAGDLDLADQRAADYEEFSSAGQFLAWAIAKITTGLVATHRGRFPEAITSIEQALAALAAEASLPWRLPARLLLARAYAAIGKIDQAERVLADAKEHSGDYVALHEPHRLIAKATLAAAKTGERQGIELAHEAADLARRSGQYAVEAEALHHAARFGDLTVAQRLAELADQIDGPVATLQARHAAALAAGDGQGLDVVSIEFEAMGMLLSAADSAAQAVPLHEGERGRRKKAESSARALRLATQCGGAATPAIRSAARPLPLSMREREIAMMVAAGLSNREIADQLTVSVRTVEGHIYRACIKLDVADREELAKIVRPDMDPE